MEKQIKIIVEKHPDGYVAYSLGLKGVVVSYVQKVESICTSREIPARSSSDTSFSERPPEINLTNGSTGKLHHTARLGLTRPYRFNILIVLRSGSESIKVVIHFSFDTRICIDRQHPLVAGASQSSDSVQ